jgi:hypothetical protein
VKDYALVIIFVAMLAVLWIILNEVVMGVGNVALDMVDGTAADLVNFLITIYRLFPIAMVLGVFAWCFMRAFRREPFQQYGGP